MPEEPGTRFFDVSQTSPEAQACLDLQEPPTELPAEKIGQMHTGGEQAVKQRVLPGHPLPPATVIYCIKEKHDRYNVS